MGEDGKGPWPLKQPDIDAIGLCPQCGRKVLVKDLEVNAGICTECAGH
jgi:acetyl-CoA carboxylase beta subunit